MGEDELGLSEQAKSHTTTSVSTGKCARLLACLPSTPLMHKNTASTMAHPGDLQHSKATTDRCTFCAMTELVGVDFGPGEGRKIFFSAPPLSALPMAEEG